MRKLRELNTNKMIVGSISMNYIDDVRPYKCD